MRVEVRVTSEHVHLHRVGGNTALLATHPRSRIKGTWMVDEMHWAGLPTGTTPRENEVIAILRDEPALIASRSRNALVVVHHRDLSFYHRVGAA